MAYHFHDLSPYVLIGNPLTLSVIEFFAVPGALLGAALYPLGLDAPVWLYVGMGIKFILWAARFIAEAPGSTLHLRAFAPYALPFLALAVMSATIWRSWLFRASAIPFAIVGLIGATQGPRYDVIVSPSGTRPRCATPMAASDRRQALQPLRRRTMADRRRRRARPSVRARPGRPLRPARLRRGFAGGGVSLDRPRPDGVRGGLRAGGGDRQPARRASLVQSEIRARPEGAGADGGGRPELERRHGLCDDERPLDG